MFMSLAGMGVVTAPPALAQTRARVPEEALKPSPKTAPAQAPTVPPTQTPAKSQETPAQAPAKSQETEPAAPEPLGKAEYQVGISDVLEIHIFGQSQADQPTLYTISPSGTIRFPYVGDVLVVGKTVAQIHDQLTKRLSDGYIMDPQLSVGVKEYNSLSVTVLGEIQKPGRYPLRGPTTLLEILSEAGLTKTSGGQATIARMEEGNNKIYTVKLDDMFSNNFEKVNIPIRNGDVINVTRSEGSRFYVQGEVAKPGPYDLERGMTVLKAISVAGGFGKFANKKVLIKSMKEGKEFNREVDVGKIERGKSPDVSISGGDIIVVPKRSF